MTQSTLAIGSRVKVTTRQGGAFYASSYDKIGVVTALTQHRVDVRFDDGSEDYGFRTAVTVVTPAGVLAIGKRVKVTARSGGGFYSRYEGKEGVVTSVGQDSVHVRFDVDGEVDYGRKTDVELLEPVKDAQGFVQNTEKKLPAARGTLMDVLYNDGTLILDLPIGTGTSKRASNNSNSYSATTWSGLGNAGIKAFRLPADRPIVAPTIKTIAISDMKAGQIIRVASAEGNHNHWGFKVGRTYTAVDRGLKHESGSTLRHNWDNWVFELVAEAPAPTLDEQLAALKAELVGIEAEKAAAEVTVRTGQAAVEAAEAKRVVLVGRLAAHGIQFIETPVVVTAQEAFAAGTLEVGVTLLAVSPEDEHEHTAGREYKVIARDGGDSSEFKLESNDGYGWWIRNEELDNYTVVA